MKKFTIRAIVPAALLATGIVASAAIPAPAYAQEEGGMSFTFNGVTYERVTRVNHRGFWHEGGMIYEEFSDIAYVPGPAPIATLEDFIGQLQARGIPVYRY